jgi:hypothetical protein
VQALHVARGNTANYSRQDEDGCGGNQERDQGGWAGGVAENSGGV